MEIAKHAGAADAVLVHQRGDGHAAAALVSQCPGGREYGNSKPVEGTTAYSSIGCYHTFAKVVA